ncbi:parB-like nuclease domain protein [Burkholderia pseudomallei MSHR2990]|uniref:ParB N-terminal domain-containing protein n=1 Tax=Burkholderia pseudomallei TaxID=28450 RepID=UPI000536E81A|nr:ParB N-terminal domain-containing protein [Burkholderia pseudomallei]KGW74828.1 parB-like nuclease domain protein [Burkholderia pseudomallei MSHR2990]
MTASLPLQTILPRAGITLLRPEQLLPTEEFIEARVHEVSREIEAEGCWRHPVLVEQNTHVIMDGHHRREFALRRGYAWIPCLMLDYSRVILESRRPDLVLTPDDVISRGLQRRPYPAKTTRHVLRGGIEYHCDFALAELRHAGACTT